MSIQENEFLEGSLIGACAGEAMGATVEFMSAEAIKAKYGILKDIVGGGAFGWEQGEATDDIDMMFSVADSLIENEMILIPEDVAKKLLDWFNSGPKDIGNTTRIALTRLFHGASWDKASDPNYEGGAGNGSIVRCLPIIIAYRKQSLSNCLRACDDAGIITHAHPLARWSVLFFAALMHRLLNNHDLSVAITDAQAWADTVTPYNFRIQSKPTGFACDALATALDCIQKTDNFEDAIIMAVNLGGDADSIAAVCGAIAGAIYGSSTIPQRWTDKLKKKSLDKTVEFVKMVR